MESLYVLLSHEDIAPHLEVSTASLPRQDIRLALHEGVLDPQVLLSLNVGAEARLNLAGCVFTAEHAVFPISHLSHEALDLGLDHHQALALPSKLLSLSITSPGSLDVDHKKLLGIGQHHISVPALVRIHAKEIFHYHL